MSARIAAALAYRSPTFLASDFITMASISGVSSSSWLDGGGACSRTCW